MNNNYKRNSANIQKADNIQKKPIPKKKQKSGEARLYKLLVFFIVFFVLTVITVICISCSHNYTAPSDTQGKITLVESTNEPNENTDISHYLVGDTIYISFTKLALECNMIITGTEAEQTFTVTHENENEAITFTVDSELTRVNGVEVQMQSKAVLKNNEIWVSASFVQNTVSGVTVNFDAEANTLTVKRNELNASTPQNPKYEEIYFKHNITEPIDTVTDSASGTQPPISEPEIEFKLDLSKYESYMNPSKSEDYLIIANRENLLSADYVPENLTLVYKASGTANKYKMTYTAAMAFEALVKEAAANGINIFAVSGYRSYSTQDSTFNSYVNKHINEGMTYEQAFAEASTYSQIAGASEHQTGLTMDVNRLEQDFGDTKEGKWLAENSWKFGFIIRYPEDKEDITKIDYEPWHLRYVGRSNAIAMNELNMCLEEYVEYLEKQ